MGFVFPFHLCAVIKSDYRTETIEQCSTALAHLVAKWPDAAHMYLKQCINVGISPTLRMAAWTAVLGRWVDTFGM